MKTDKSRIAADSVAGAEPRSFYKSNNNTLYTFLATCRPTYRTYPTYQNPYSTFTCASAFNHKSSNIALETTARTNCSRHDTMPIKYTRPRPACVHSPCWHVVLIPQSSGASNWCCVGTNSSQGPAIANGDHAAPTSTYTGHATITNYASPRQRIISN